MVRKTSFGRVASAALVIGSVLWGASAKAQDVSDEQIQAARAAITALGLTDQFDNILPGLAERQKHELILTYPNLEEEISSSVDKNALALAPRRADLEREAATVYAKSFTTEELKQIADFYNSDTGKKFIKDGPVALREMAKAADIWASGIARDLNKRTNEAMLALVGKDGAAAAEAPKP